MKHLMIAILMATLPLSAQGKKGGPETEAVYIVPSEPELINHSRFIIQIVDAFKGPLTEKISYIFPEILIGEKDRLIEFTRIAGTENSWESDLLTAHCMVIDDVFSCNILVNKSSKQSWNNWIEQLTFPKAYAAVSNLCQGQALAHLPSMGLSQTDVNHYSKVINSFCLSEPAGFLSYEFD